MKLSLGRWIASIGAVVAMAAQLTVAFSQLTEGREGRSAASHVETSGTARHFGHNEATCATCQARSLQGLAERAPAPLVRDALSATAVATAIDRLPNADVWKPTGNAPNAKPHRETATAVTAADPPASSSVVASAAISAPPSAIARRSLRSAR